MTDPILVVGTTGTQGGAVAHRLAAAGVPVRALVRRDLELPGVEPVKGDLDDAESLAAAVRGVSGLFAVPPAFFGTDDREAVRMTALAETAARAGVERVVLSTVASAGGRLPPGKAAVEARFRELLPQVTILRPARFMSNFLATGYPVDGIDDGVHRHLFPPDEPVQSIAPQDIAEFAALAFADPARYAGRTLELAGDAVTPLDAVAAISEATGVPVRYHEVMDAEAAALAPALAEARASWLAGNHWAADIEALRVIHPGLRTFADWLKEGGAARLTATVAG